MSLTYQIKSNLTVTDDNDVTTEVECNSGGNIIPPELIYLAEIDVESADNGAELLLSIENESLSIYANGEEVTDIPTAQTIMFAYVDGVLKDETIIKLVKADIAIKNKTRKLRDRGAEYIAEAEYYKTRREKGQEYVEIQMGVLMTEAKKGLLTEAQLQRLDDLAIGALLEAGAGQWKTSIGTLMKVQNSAGFDSEDSVVKDYINGYVTEMVGKLPSLNY